MRWERVRKRLKTEGIIRAITEKSTEATEKKEVRCRRSGERKAGAEWNCKNGIGGEGFENSRPMITYFPILSSTDLIFISGVENRRFEWISRKSKKIKQ